jgi:uncharacterized protein YukE
MALIGADVDQLRALAQRIDNSVDALNTAVKTLSSLTSDVSRWRGTDADRFRSEWSEVAVPGVSRTVDALRGAADMIRRNADEQDHASADGARSSLGATQQLQVRHESAPQGLSGLWDEVSHVSKDDNSAGYRIQTVVGADGQERYIVYIGGTDAAEGQSKLSNISAANGIPDDKQLAALRRLIPDGAEVMLVGYSQGGMDAQNIAAQIDNGFQVTQLVTYGSPVRPDLDVPAVHLQANGDGVPNSASIFPWSPFLTNSTGTNAEAHIYHGKPDVGGISANIHMSAYGGLAGKWDEAKFNTADGVSRFQGTVRSTKDLDMNGNVM